MALPTSDHARLLDTDAHCIKFICTYSLETCNDKLRTVMNEMALGRLNADLPRIGSCLSIMTHLRYRIICLTNDMSAESQGFKSHYEHIFYQHLKNLNSGSPLSNASSKKPRLIPGFQDLSIDAPSTSGVKAVSKKKTRRGRASTIRRRNTREDKDPAGAECQTTPHPSDVGASPPTVDTVPREYGIDKTYPSEIEECSCVTLRAPHVFHASCVDLTHLLEPFEPLTIRGFYGERIEIQNPLKHIGIKRSQPDDFSVDDLISVCSTRRLASSSLSTQDFVDWRELLSWASMYLRFQ